MDELDEAIAEAEDWTDVEPDAETEERVQRHLTAHWHDYDEMAEDA